MSLREHAIDRVAAPYGAGSLAWARSVATVRRGYDWGNMDRPRLFLIDAFGFIFRAYHARARSGAPPMRTRAGMATEAVYIFHNMLRRLLAAHKPDQLAAVFEGEGPTFREQVFEAYKANRTETPPDLIEQIPLVRRLLEAMRIPVLSYAGYEADDVIGAIARQAEAAGLEVVVVSSDKDMIQLVGDGDLHAQPHEGRRVVRRRQGEGVSGGGAVAGGGPAGPQGRRQRQHPRRAGHRGQGRAGVDRALRFGGGRARGRRLGGAQDVPREPAEQPRADSDEQAAGYPGHVRAGGLVAGAVSGGAAGPGGVARGLPGTRVLQLPEGPPHAASEPRTRASKLRDVGDAGGGGGMPGARFRPMRRWRWR